MTYKQSSRVAILGFGIEGKSAADYLRTRGITDITVCDKNPSAEDKSQGLKWQLGAGYLDNLTDYDIVIRSPGIPFATPEIQHAIRSHVKVTSVTKLFFEKCPCRIVGVTGTKGKGTTCSLLYEILKKAGRDAYLGGNIGNSPLDFLNDLKENSIAILELGHGQTGDLNIGPDIGIVLGVTEDHLDYHPDLEAYQASKHPILKSQKKDQKAIINIDYPGNKPFLKLSKGKKYHISTHKSVRRGAYLYKKDLILKTGFFPQKLMPKTEVALLGKHNLENVLPAALAAQLLGVDEKHIIETTKTFKGLPHRLEFIAEKNGIRFINDSFSTTPLTSMAAIRSFEEPIILIAGGSEKHADFTEWAQVAATRSNLHEILLIGETAGRMLEALQKAGYQNGRMTKHLEGTFEFIKHNAKPGDTVVLSPACASFDLFKNYKKRGEQFKKQVKSLT